MLKEGVLIFSRSAPCRRCSPIRYATTFARSTRRRPSDLDDKKPCCKEIPWSKKLIKSTNNCDLSFLEVPLIVLLSFAFLQTLCAPGSDAVEDVALDRHIIHNVCAECVCVYPSAFWDRENLKTTYVFRDLIWISHGLTNSNNNDDYGFSSGVHCRTIYSPRSIVCYPLVRLSVCLPACLSASYKFIR